MTEKEKALGYLQMLKDEGKLDDNALDELTSMYTITRGEAEKLLSDFRQTPVYEKSAAKNITYFLVSFIVSAGTAAVFGFMAFSHNGSPVFAIHFYIMFLAAIGAFIYLSKLVTERYRMAERYPWLQNKALPALILMLPLFLYFQYNLTNKTYLADPREWVKLPPMILSEDCKEISTGGRSPDYYYTLHVGEYMDAFHYNSIEHRYCFTTLNPSDLLKRGDTVSLWVEKAANPDLQTSSNNKVWDISYKGKRMLDITCRNRKAKANSEQNRNIILLVLVVTLLIFAFSQAKSFKTKIT